MKGSSVVLKVLGTIVIVGARKFMFSNQVQSSNRVRWWGPVDEGDRNIVPNNLCEVFVKQGLARAPKLKELALSLSAEFHEFNDESEVFPLFARTLGIDPDRSTEVASVPRPDLAIVTRTIVHGDMLLKEDRVIDVPVNRIRRFEKQPRKYFNKERLLALGRSLLQGQQIPVILVPVDNDPEHDYQLYDGERRWRACQLVGKKTLRAIIAKGMTEARLFKGSAICNFGREDHQQMEIALALKQIKSDEGLTHQELADSFARSVFWVTQHIGLLKLVPEVQEMLNPELPEDQQITYSVALEIVKVSSNHQFKAARHILDHNMSLPQVRHYIRKLTAQIGVSSVHRQRKPDDDYRILQTFLRHASMRADQFLDMPQGMTIEDLFRKRSWMEVEAALNTLDLLIGKLRKIQTVIKKADK
jgi:ParB family chromosome partitioning protein